MGNWFPFLRSNPSPPQLPPPLPPPQPQYPAPLYDDPEYPNKAPPPPPPPRMVYPGIDDPTTLIAEHNARVRRVDDIIRRSASLNALADSTLSEEGFSGFTEYLSILTPMQAVLPLPCKFRMFFRAKGVTINDPGLNVLLGHLNNISEAYIKSLNLHNSPELIAFKSRFSNPYQLFQFYDDYCLSIASNAHVGLRGGKTRRHKKCSRHRNKKQSRR